MMLITSETVLRVDKKLSGTEHLFFLKKRGDEIVAYATDELGAWRWTEAAAAALEQENKREGED